MMTSAWSWPIWPVVKVDPENGSGRHASETPQMSILIKCTCGRALNLRDELAGKLIRCPACSGSVRLPELVFDVVEEVIAGPPPLGPQVKPPVVAQSPSRKAIGPPPLPIPSAPPQPRPRLERPASQPKPMAITEFVDEPAASPPPVSRSKTSMPPVQTAVNTTPAAPAPDAACQEADIPEFEHLDVLDDDIDCEIDDRGGAAAPNKYLSIDEAEWDKVQIRKRTAAEADRDHDEDAWETAWLQKTAANDTTVKTATRVDEPDDWENLQLREDGTYNGDQPTTDGTSNMPIAEEDESTAYRLGADTGIGLDLTTVGPRSEVRVDADAIECLAYGANHKTHLAAADDEVFCLDFDRRISTPLARMHSGEIGRLAISADCRLALSGDADGGLLLWDLVRYEPLRWLDGHRSAVTAVAFSTDGMHAASGSDGGAVWLWNIATGERLPLPQGQLESRINCVAFSPDGRLLVAIANNGKSRLWSVADRAIAGKLEAGSAALHTVAFTQSGQSIVAGSSKRFKVCKWDVPGGTRQPAYMGFSNKQPRIRRTWVTSQANCLLALSHRFKPPPRYEPVPIATPLPLAWSVGIFLIRTAVQAHRSLADELKSSKPIFYLELWDAVSERGLSAISLGPTPPSAVACSPDGHRVLAGFDDAIVVLFGL